MIRCRALVGLLGMVALVATSIVGTAGPAGSASGDITLFGDAIPTLTASGGVVTGPDGNLWFGNQRSQTPGYLNEVTPAGAITQHPIAEHDFIDDVTVGGDGNIWFTTRDDEVGRFNPNTNTYALFPSPVTFSNQIATGPSGSVWVLGTQGGEVLLNGTLGSSIAGLSQSSTDIMLGPDNNIWVSTVAGSLFRVNPANGSSVEFDTPNATDDPIFVNPVSIRQMTIGPNDDIWFTYADGENFGGIGYYDIDQDMFETFPFASNPNPQGITYGPDGNLWWLSNDDDAINRFTPTGTNTAFTDADFDIGSSGHEITVGPDDNIWAGGLDNVARVDATPVDPACLPPAFNDVGTSHPFFDDICWMDVQGISNGYNDGSYRPSIAVSRQAMSAFMYRLAGEPPFEPEGQTFNDVPLNHPFYDEIEWMADEGISEGFAGGTYRPGIAVSRQAMSAFMYRLVDEPPFEPEGQTFNDVPLNHPFYDEIEWMASEGISEGFAGGTYRPGVDVSRQAMSAFMHRLADAFP